MAEENFGADSGLKALCGVFLGYCLYLRGDQAASNPLLKSLAKTTDGWVDLFATAYELQARQAFIRGGLARALEITAQADRLAQERHLPRLGQVAAAWRVEFLALAGRRCEARREAAAGEVFAAAEARGVPDMRWRLRLAATMAIARLSATEGATAGALQLLESAAMEFLDAGLLLPSLRLETLAIAVLKQRGAQEEALSRLQRLLEYVAAEGAIGLLLEQGGSLERLLLLALRRNQELILSGAQRDLISQAIGMMQHGDPGEACGFSARELAVLRELCNGRSNKAIGETLDLSENTVKFHLKRIFRKLGADSRAAAVKVALQKHLVPPGEADTTG